MRIQKIKCWNLPELIAILLLLAFAIVGCPETEQIVGPVVTKPSEPAEEPAEPTTTVGDEKQEPEEPTTEPKPTEPETPEEPTEEPDPKPEPTITIGDITPVDSGAVLIVGSSTNLPSMTVITITVGNSITRIATTDPFGNWSMSVPAAEIERLAAGTIIVTASAADISDSSSFVIEGPKQDPIEIESVTFYENVQRTKEMTEDSQVRLGDLDTIYTEVVLKESVETPLQIEFSIDGVTTPYNRARKDFRPRDGEYNELEKGVYLCLYIPLEGTPSGIFDLIIEGVRYTAPTEIKPVEVYPTRESIFREYFVGGRGIPDHVSSDPYFRAYFGFPYEFVTQHLINIFLEERPDDGRGLRYWSAADIAVEYFYLQQHNPDANEEELEELFRESVRGGEVLITGDFLPIVWLQLYPRTV